MSHSALFLNLSRRPTSRYVRNRLLPGLKIPAICNIAHAPNKQLSRGMSDNHLKRVGKDLPQWLLVAILPSVLGKKKNNAGYNSFIKLNHESTNNN